MTHDDFSHIYYERGVEAYPLMVKLRDKFRRAVFIEIEDYKEIFNRPRQDIPLQQMTKKLIIAHKKDNFLYKGPSIIQAFGCENLHYSAMVLGCPYSCDFCYLQGMYESSNIVVFINIDDYLDAAKKLLMTDSLYLCLSYDTDLLALEKMFGFVERWIDLVNLNPRLTVEIRTKSSNFRALSHLSPHERVIFATSLSPQEMIDRYEQGTASLEARLRSLRLAQEKGWRVRVCFEPVLYGEAWEEEYARLIERTFEVLDPSLVRDLNCDIFRISPTYLKRMQKGLRPSKVLWYPYEVREGLATYDVALESTMKQKLSMMLERYIAKEKIYV